MARFVCRGCAATVRRHAFRPTCGAPLPTAAFSTLILILTRCSVVNALSHCIGLLSARMLSGERRGMSLIGSLALLGISLVLLFFGRGRDGDALPFLQKGIAAYMFAIVVFALFVAGLEGTAVNLGWLR